MKHRITLIFILCCSIVCTTALAQTYQRPTGSNDMIGKAFVINPNSGETLADVGARYNVGVHEMIEANQRYKNSRLSSRDRIVIPTAFILPLYQEGIVINIPELRLYYFPKGSNEVYTYPVGLGRSEWRTPTAKATVTRKKEYPNWHPPKSIREFVYENAGITLPDVVRPGPENPLGPRAIYLSKRGYLIHGTNQPWTIGKLVSSGCIRLYNHDVEELYSMVTEGTPVHLIHHPYKVGWSNGDLYLEAHIPVASDEPSSNLNVHDVEQAVKAKLDKHPELRAKIDWNRVDRAVHEQRGIPFIIGESADHYVQRSQSY